MALPDDNYPTHERVAVKVHKQPYVRFDSNDYSIPHNRIRRTLTVLATPEQVRIADGDQIIASHERSFDRKQQIEDPSHIEALVAAKKKARQQRGIDRLHHAVPAVSKLLEGAAQRGHNLGSAVAALVRLLDNFGVQELAIAVNEALDADALHVAAVRQVLERRRQEAGQPPALPVELPDDPRVREVTVKPHDLKTYDDIEATNV